VQLVLAAGGCIGTLLYFGAVRRPGHDPVLVSEVATVP
jgi:hypothetical protein